MMEDNITTDEKIEKASEAVEDEDATSEDWVLTDSQYAQVQITNVRPFLSIVKSSNLIARGEYVRFDSC